MQELKNILKTVGPKSLTTGSLLKAWCKNFSYTQKEISDLTGIKPPNISAIFNDKQSLTLENAIKIATVIGIHPRDLLFPNGHIKKSKAVLDLEKKLRQDNKKRKASS